MVFYIYDPHGFRSPFEAGKDWRKIGNPSAPLFDEETRRRQQRETKIHKIDRETLEKAIRFDPEHFGGKASGNPQTPLVAQQIMSQPVVTRGPKDHIEEAWDLICTNRFRHLPILEDGHLVGILSDRRLNNMLVSSQRQGTDHPIVISEVMITPVLSARPYTAVSDIAKTFVTERIGAMPILDDHDTLIGIITRSDILRTLIRVHGLEFLRI